MNSILPLREENISGLLTLDFIPVNDVDVIEEPWLEEIATAVTLQPSKAWMQLAFTQETGDYKCSEEKSGSGSLQKFTLAGFTPKMQLATAAVFSEMRESKFILIAKDANGKKRLIGTKLEPVRFTYAEATEPNYGVRQGYTWSFYRDFIDPPPYYTA